MKPPPEIEDIHWFRRLLLLVIGVAFAGGGFYLLYLFISSGHFYSGWFALGAGFAIFFGLYILWEDIAKPALQRRKRRLEAAKRVF